MRPFQTSHLCLCVALCTLASACTRPSASDAVAAPAPAGCLADGAGQLLATVRGALVADIDWRDAQMQCEGDLRPDGKGLRVTLAGPMPAIDSAAGQPATLRFIFGIDLQDIAAGDAVVLPTNVTVIVEGAQQLYSTRGDDKCAVEDLQRTPLAAAGSGQERIEARGYCTGPASTIAGDARVLIPTFSFTALARTENP